MLRHWTGWALILIVASLARASAQEPQEPQGPLVVVFETVKGTIEFELFPEDAPKSVEHIVHLVRTNFYRGLRFHRVERSLAQIGDPLSRDVSRRGYWGSGGSGNPIGVAEYSRRRRHVRGAVGLAHAGVAEYADSQIYFMKESNDRLDGVHVVIGRVTEGMSVVDRLGVPDLVKVAYIKGEGRPF